jgi:hypothetical protein
MDDRFKPELVIGMSQNMQRPEDPEFLTNRPDI